MIHYIADLVPKKNKQKRICVALSGGVDSVAACHFLKVNCFIEIEAIHFNHNQREQNQKMEKHVRDFCKAFEIPLHVGKAEKLLKTEADFREERLRFFQKNAEEEAKERKRDTIIITAHHLDDATETYMLKCLAGKVGKEIFPLITNFPSFTITHPFLLSLKKDFKRYVEEKNLSGFVVEDETNKSNGPGARRNWVRNNLLPQIRNEGIELKTTVKKKIKEEVNRIFPKKSINKSSLIKE